MVRQSAPPQPVRISPPMVQRGPSSAPAASRPEPPRGGFGTARPQGGGESRGNRGGGESRGNGGRNR